MSAAIRALAPLLLAAVVFAAALVALYRYADDLREPTAREDFIAAVTAFTNSSFRATCESSAQYGESGFDGQFLFIKDGPTRVWAEWRRDVQGRVASAAAIKTGGESATCFAPGDLSAIYAASLAEANFDLPPRCFVGSSPSRYEVVQLSSIKQVGLMIPGIWTGDAVDAVTLLPDVIRRDGSIELAGLAGECFAAHIERPSARREDPSTFRACFSAEGVLLALDAQSSAGTLSHQVVGVAFEIRPTDFVIPAYRRDELRY